MNTIISLLEKEENDNIRRFSFLWFMGNHCHENMKDVENLSKSELIEILVEDFYESELHEQDILSQYEKSFQVEFYDNMLERIIPFKTEWEKYNSSLS